LCGGSPLAEGLIMEYEEQSEQDVQRAASALASAWRTKCPLLRLPTEGPMTLDGAYEVQAAMAAIIGPVGGWKVAPLRESEPMCCPIPLRLFHKSPAKHQLLSRANMVLEGEIAFRFSRDMPARSSPYDLDEVVTAIAAVHPIIEVIGSRFADRNAQPPFHAVADLQNCDAVIVGPGRDDWQSLEFSNLTGHFVVDNVEVSALGERPSTQRTLEAVTWLVNHAHQRDMSIMTDDIIITGARIGPVSSLHGANIVLHLDDLGEVSLSLD
jgi:2-keto-4-pentenoate hydratase